MSLGKDLTCKLGNMQISYGWVVLAACLAINIASVGIRLSFGVFFKPLETEFGWTRAVTSGVFSAYLIVSGIVGIPGGWALDRYHPRKVFVVTGLLTTFGLILTGLAEKGWHVFVSYSLLLAMGTGPTYVIVMALISRWFFDRRGLALGIVSCGVGIGMAVFSPIAESIISAYDWRSSYFALAVIAFAVMMPCAFLVRRNPSDQAALASVSASDGASLATGHESFFADPSQPSLVDALKTRNFWLLLSILFLWAFCVYIILAHIVRHAIDIGVPSMQAATILTIIGGVSIPARLLIGRLSDSWGSIRLSLLSVVILIVAMPQLLWASDLLMLYLFAILFGLSWAGSAPLVAALIVDTFGTRHLGIIFGVLEIGWAVGSSFGPLLAGRIYDVNGNYALAFLAGTGMTVVAALLIRLLRVGDYGKRSHV